MRVEALENRLLFTADLLQGEAVIQNVAEVAEADSDRVMILDSDSSKDRVATSETDSKAVDTAMAQLSPTDDMQTSRDATTSQANDPNT